MKRVAFAILAGISLVLSIAAATGWILSYARPLYWKAIRVSHDPLWTQPEYLELELQIMVGPAEPSLFLAPVRQTPSGAIGDFELWWASSRAGGLTVVRHYGRMEDGVLVQASATSADWLSVFDFFFARGLQRVSLDAGAQNDFSFLGFRIRHVSLETPVPANRARVIPVNDYRRYRIDAITIPYWMICILGLPLPGLWSRRRMRSRRWARQGRCTRCGYDLRASPERCPECGHAM